MTLLKPTLTVNRLVVFQGGHTAFDCEFHSGVNVIRGRNSSGKTTVMDLLAFSLGAENIRWKPEALQCTETMVEVQLNGDVACLRREISEETQRPLVIFWGPFDEAVNTGPHRWERYPFKRTVHQTSFSQALFEALDLPQAQGEGASNLTLHQILRVLYADQPSVHSPIFRDDVFDSMLTREMVGGYLCGVYDDELYSAQLRLREVNVLLNKHISELKGIFNVLGRSGQTPDLQFANDKIQELEVTRMELTDAMVQLKNDRALSRKDANRARAKADDLRAKLNDARRKEAAQKDALAAIELDVGDSLLFVRELEARLQNLEESKETRSYFGVINFAFCPSCLSELKETRTDSHHCHLCTSELADNKGNSQLLRMHNELNIQLKESKSLIEERTKKAEALRRDIPALTEEIKRLEREYASVSSSWSSEVEIALEEMARKLGVLDEEIRQAYERQKLASVITDLQKRRDELNSEFARLEERIENLEQQQEGRKAEVARAVERAMVRLLKLDLPLQPEFVDAKTAAFSFVDNTVSVNGSRNFSESSAVVLRHIFHLALLTASTENAFMRVPRFMMLDGIDDGGMEKDRSHKLQEIIVEECATYKADFQLIFATSEINPDFEDSDLVVGRAFDSTNRSLDIR
jgi:multidrug efflux pump subunit AcrA (membrane-fusion protein)